LLNGKKTPIDHYPNRVMLAQNWRRLTQSAIR
jgi:hypothetical protein